MTYKIYHYPAELIDVVHLTNGQRVVIRPILPQDHELLAVYFHDLSDKARCNRFMHPVREPSSALLRQFTQVDFATHVGLIAEIVVDSRETVIGEACYVRGPDPQVAEFALSVAGSCQRKGLAKVLLAKLEAGAAVAGIRHFVGETLATNEGMLSFARKTEFKIGLGVRGVTRLEKVLVPEGSCPRLPGLSRAEAAQ